ncbi:MAG: aminotransferase class I/II-fold pyridoxal phosphate-dependent enzyme [Spirochaetales bacterium]|nr:aminotransferase class I/II-fold pyridoxal phosphate-dependent enzyme [Spirochaetales bacterium]
MDNATRTPVEDFLSPRAARWSLPRTGFMAQGAEAAGSELNSSIGVALKDDGTPLVLPSLSGLNNLPDEALLYSGCSGELALREKWARIKGQSRLPLVTAGLTHGLNLAGHLFLEPGDSLYIPGPVYENYNHMFADYFQVQIRPFPLTSGEALNLEGIGEILNGPEETVRFLFNFPQNPTGYSPTKDDVDRLLPLLTAGADRGKRILILLDDAYQGLNHGEDLFPASLFTVLEDLHDNILTVKLDGATKEYCSWGLRIGFISFGRRGMTDEEYDLLEDKTASLVRSGISNISRLAQEMLLDVLNNPEGEAQKKAAAALIASRYRRVKEELASHKEYGEEFLALPFNSGYFFCVRLREGLDAHEIRRKLRREFSTGVMVPEAGMLRLAYSSLAEEKVPQVLRNVYDACRKS